MSGAAFVMWSLSSSKVVVRICQLFSSPDYSVEISTPPIRTRGGNINKKGLDSLRVWALDVTREWNLCYVDHVNVIPRTAPSFKIALEFLVREGKLTEEDLESKFFD
ncbi:hypothetical protein C0J52_25624 [Blattella germanica]|nr:hypothetical protein C0J52_25624 [Blattella germanica]